MRFGLVAALIILGTISCSQKTESAKPVPHSSQKKQLEGWTQEQILAQTKICIDDLTPALDDLGAAAKAKDVCDCYIAGASKIFSLPEFEKPTDYQWETQKAIINGCLAKEGIGKEFRFFRAIRVPNEAQDRRSRFKKRVDELRGQVPPKSHATKDAPKERKVEAPKRPLAQPSPEFKGTVVWKGKCNYGNDPEAVVEGALIQHVDEDKVKFWDITPTVAGQPDHAIMDLIKKGKPDLIFSLDGKSEVSSKGSQKLSLNVERDPLKSKLKREQPRIGMVCNYEVMRIIDVRKTEEERKSVEKARKEFATPKIENKFLRAARLMVSAINTNADILRVEEYSQKQLGSASMTRKELRDLLEKSEKYASDALNDVKEGGGDPLLHTEIRTSIQTVRDLTRKVYVLAK